MTRTQSKRYYHYDYELVRGCRPSVGGEGTNQVPSFRDSVELAPSWLRYIKLVLVELNGVPTVDKNKRENNGAASNKFNIEENDNGSSSNMLPDLVNVFH